jgi:hypothetical protein
VPILCGVLFPSFDRRGALVAALVGLVGHFGLYAWGRIDPAAPASLANPGVTATTAIMVSAGVAALTLLVARPESVGALEPQS